MKYRLNISESYRGTEWLDFRRESDFTSSWLCTILKTEINPRTLVENIESGESVPYKMGILERLVVRLFWNGLNMRKIGSIGSKELSGATVEFYWVEKKTAIRDLMVKSRNYRMGESEVVFVDLKSAIHSLERYAKIKKTEPNQRV